jgi:hypothetical protein
MVITCLSGGGDLEDGEDSTDEREWMTQETKGPITNMINGNRKTSLSERYEMEKHQTQNVDRRARGEGEA